MSETQFNSGDNVFDECGRRYQYVVPHPSGSGHICLPEYETDDRQDVQWGDPITIPIVYANEEQPKQKASAELAGILARIQEAKAQWSATQKEQIAFDSQARERMLRLTRYEALKNLDDFLAGKITHFVIVNEYGFGPDVVPRDVALKADEGYGQKLKLLTLYGASNGDLQFRINRYSDGSGGSSYDAYPFTSEDEALAFIKNFIQKKLDEIVKSDEFLKGGIPYQSKRWAEAGRKYGVAVPGVVNQRIAENEIKNAEAELAEARKGLDRIIAKLIAAKGGAL